jgi:putative multiple sugar transport system permease protein
MGPVTTDTPRSAPPADAPARTAVTTLLLDAMRRNMRKYGMLIALALIVALFAIWTDGVLLQPNNVTNLVLQNSYILVLAIGMMIVIIAGHIDLSVGSLAAFVSAACAVMMVEHDVPWVLALVIALAIGAAAGAWQGFWIAYVGIPSFIVTLAGMLLFRGGTQILLGSRSLGPFPEGFQKISTGYLPEVGPATNYHNLTLLLGLVLIVFALTQEVRDRRSRAPARARAGPRADNDVSRMSVATMS